MATYALKSGDYPWNLAVKFTGNGNRWPELCAANPKLAKHATYGCVFPKVGTEINIPDSWVTSSTSSLVLSPTSASVTTSAPTGILASLFGGNPTTTTVNLTTTNVPSTAAASTAADTTPPGTAPAVTTSITQASAASNPAYNPEYVKYGLIAAGIVAAGVIAYLGLTSKDGNVVAAPGTAKMKSNPRRRHGKGKRRHGRRMRRNGKTMTKEQAVREFKIDNLGRFRGDAPAVRQAWNEWVDHLQKSGQITEKQAFLWDQPDFVKKGKIPSNWR